VLFKGQNTISNGFTASFDGLLGSGCAEVTAMLLSPLAATLIAQHSLIQWHSDVAPIREASLTQLMCKYLVQP